MRDAAFVTDAPLQHCGEEDPHEQHEWLLNGRRMQCLGTPEPLAAYDLEERVERIETLLSCLVIHGDNLPSFDQGPKVAREILAEIQRELSEANDVRPYPPLSDEDYRRAANDMPEKVADPVAANVCGKFVSWWDGEYEGNCELPEGHEGNHFDGLSWFTDDGESVEELTDADA